MCFDDPAFPCLIPVHVTSSSTGTKLLTVSLLLGKVTTIRHGEHISFRGMRYPLLETIHDSQAIPGSHDSAMHFAATPVSAIGLPDEFGSHRLAVLPGTRVWDSLKDMKLRNRCWHSDSCTPLICLDCGRLRPEDLSNPDFWRGLTTWWARRMGNRIVQEQIWHRQIVVPKK
jgi:hypothetical protein